jgi:hypothetical protein
MTTTLRVSILSQNTLKHSEDERIVIAASLEQALEIAGISTQDYQQGKWVVEVRPVVPSLVAHWAYSLERGSR